MINLIMKHSSTSALQIIFLGIVLPTMLAGCGGGSDSTSTVESSSDGMKTALGTSGSSTVPSPWKGRAPRMEVINGITVPPAPDPDLVSATVAGVDINGNSVRDDVERQVAQIAPLSFTSTLAAAAVIERQAEGVGLRPVDQKALKSIICGQLEIPPSVMDVLYSSVALSAKMAKNQKGESFILTNCD